MLILYWRFTIDGKVSLENAQLYLIFLCLKFRGIVTLDWGRDIAVFIDRNFFDSIRTQARLNREFFLQWWRLGQLVSNRMHGLRPSSHRFPFHGCRYIFWQLLLESCKVYKVAASPILLDVQCHVTSNVLKLWVCQLKSVDFSLISLEFGVLEVLEGLVNNIFC